MNKFRRLITPLSNSNKRFASGPKRKYPIDPQHEKTLPVYQYDVSKENYRRVFSWGNLYTGALGKKLTKSDDNLEKERYLYFPKRLTFGEQHEVKTAACGFGFSVFAVDSETNQKIYGTGINTDSQIGYHEFRKGHPLEILFIPRPIDLPFKDPENSKVIKMAAGRAHLLVLTDEGIFTLGNNIYGQCGRKIIPDENYIMSNYIHHIEKIDGKTIVGIECGQDHSLALTEDGSVYSCGWGADGQTGLGNFNNCSEFTKVEGDIKNERIVKLSSRSDFVLALNDKGEVFGWGNTEYGQISLPEENQQVSSPQHIKMLDNLGKMRSIAAAGAFCVAANGNNVAYTDVADVLSIIGACVRISHTLTHNKDKGQVFSWGYGLLGTGPNAEMQREPVHLPDTLFGKNDYQPDSTVMEVTCGLYHAGAVTNLGDLYIWGRNKNGCLGLGKPADQFFPMKVAIGGLVEKVAFGIDHSIAICKPFI